MKPFDTNYKLIFHVLQITASKEQIIAELKDILYKDTAKAVVVCFLIHDESDYLQKLFSPYTDDQTSKFSADFITSNLSNSKLTPKNKNPFEIWNSNFSTYKKSLSNNICFAMDALVKPTKKNLRYFLSPSIDNVMSVVNADKGSPLYFIKKQMKRVKQLAHKIAVQD